MRALVVEDERHLNDVIVKKLSSSGYAVDAAYDGEEALDHLLTVAYDIVILDVMLPKKNGFDVLKEYREEGYETPVLFLTALSAVEDRITGLDSGADDYLVKPFSFEELLARMRSLLRRQRNAQASSQLKLSNLVMDTAKHEVKRGERVINLSAKEYSLLEYMMSNEGVVLDRERLLSHVWSLDYEGESNMIDVYISYLRRKIDDGEEEKLLHTVRGVGYVLRAER